jgi:hypothetical protein
MKEYSHRFRMKKIPIEGQHQTARTILSNFLKGHSHETTMRGCLRPYLRTATLECVEYLGLAFFEQKGLTLYRGQSEEKKEAGKGNPNTGRPNKFSPWSEVRSGLEFTSRMLTGLKRTQYQKISAKMTFLLIRYPARLHSLNTEIKSFAPCLRLFTIALTACKQLRSFLPRLVKVSIL